RRRRRRRDGVRLGAHGARPVPRRGRPAAGARRRARPRRPRTRRPRLRGARMKPLPLAGAALLAGYVAWRGRRLGRLELAGLLVVIAALVAYGVGLIHPPNLEHLIKDVG